MSYILFNPQVGGKSIKSAQKTINGAAEEIWSELSSNIKQYTPEFYFTIQEGGSDKLHHFKVKETLENSRVKYVLSKYNNKKISDKDIITGIKQDGGRKKRYDDSSSSSSDDEYLTYPSKRRNDNGLTLTYYPTIYGVPNILLPTFTSTIYPYVSLKFPTGLPVVFTYNKDNY